MRRTIQALLAVFLAVAALTACRVGGEASSLTPEATPPPRPPSHVEQVLALMPDTPESRKFVQVNDYRALAMQLGLEIPRPEATHEEVTAFRKEVILSAVGQSITIFDDDWISGYNRRYLPEELPDLKAGLGFDVRNVTASGRIYEKDPWSQTEIVVGEFNPELTRALLEECADCAEAPEIVTYNGATFFRWGGEGVSVGNPRNRLKQPIFDHQGRGGQLFVTESFAVRTLDTADMEAIIDAVQGDSPNLLELADWALAAEAISAHDTVATMFSGSEAPMLEDHFGLLGFGPEVSKNLPQEDLEMIEEYATHVDEIRASAPELPQYSVAATGLGIENGRHYTAFAVVFADEQQAQAGLAALEERAESGLRANSDFVPAPWSEVISETELSVSGRVVSGKVFVHDREDIRRLMMGPRASLSFLDGEPFSQFLLR